MINFNKKNSYQILLLIIVVIAIGLFLEIFMSILSSDNVGNDEAYSLPDSHIESFHIKIKKGDTLSRIFKDAGLSSKELNLLLSLGKKAKSLTSLKPGQNIQLNIDTVMRKCLNLTVWPNSLEKVEYFWDNDHYNVTKTQYKANSSVNYIKFSVTSSVFDDALKAGVDKNIIKQLVDAMSWRLDFNKKLRLGDTFQILYEQYHVPDKGLISGDLIEVIYESKVNGNIRATRYTSIEGVTAFYMPDGHKLSQEFLLSPVKYSRVSSPFSLSRKHPVLGIAKPHYGVDLAASRGKPVWSTGDGAVAFVGTKYGYGNTVVIQHDYKYKTLYAHLAKFSPKLKRGDKVKQGQVIGFVGSSGVATGPHLHYEFRINNLPANPMTVKIPRASGMTKKDKLLFAELLEKNDTARLVSQQEKEGL